MEILLNKAVEASGPSGEARSTFWFPVPGSQIQLVGCVFSDLDFLILRKSLYAACYLLISFSFSFA